MPISELLWACPVCGQDRGLEPGRDGSRCRACQTLFRRGKGAAIRALAPDGTETVHPPNVWLDQLPAPETIVAEHDSTNGPIRVAKVLIARVTGSDTVHGETGYLNRIEIWGEEQPGTLELGADALVFGFQEPEEPERWPLETLTAVQASSHTIQLRRRGLPLVSFRFLDDSVFLWEELLHEVLQVFYRRTGRGRIVEFQPRIVTE